LSRCGNTSSRLRGIALRSEIAAVATRGRGHRRCGHRGHSALVKGSRHLHTRFILWIKAVVATDLPRIKDDGVFA
jgi:hypothetical protein